MLPPLASLDDTALRRLEGSATLSDSEWRAVLAEIVRRESELPPPHGTRAPSLVSCPTCGRQVSVAAAACPQCGHPIAAPARASTAVAGSIPSRGVAIMFALFLGGLGAHKFYMGKPGLGVLYLLFCWTFVPAIISLFETILYLLTSDEQWREQFAPSLAR